MKTKKAEVLVIELDYNLRLPIQEKLYDVLGYDLVDVVGDDDLDKDLVRAGFWIKGAVMNETPYRAIAVGAGGTLSKVQPGIQVPPKHLLPEEFYKELELNKEHSYQLPAGLILVKELFEEGWIDKKDIYFMSSMPEPLKVAEKLGILHIYDRRYHETERLALNKLAKDLETKILGRSKDPDPPQASLFK